MFRKAIIKALPVPYQSVLPPDPSPLPYIDFPLYWLGLCSKQGKAKKIIYRGDTPEWERVVGKSGKEAYECERMKAIDWLAPAIMTENICKPRERENIEHIYQPEGNIDRWHLSQPSRRLMRQGKIGKEEERWRTYTTVEGERLK